MDVSGVNVARMTSPGVTEGWGLTTPTICFSLFLSCISLLFSMKKREQPLCCELWLSLMWPSCLAGWKPKLFSLPPSRGHILNYWGVHLTVWWAVIFSCMAACAVDSRGWDACRDESRNKRNQLQRSSRSHQPVSPPLTPGDMKPIILMGLGSIHLNTGLHMMTTMILNVPPAPELPGSRFGVNPRRKIFYRIHTSKKAWLVSQSNPSKIIYQTRFVCLCTCPSKHPFFIVCGLPIFHFLNHDFNYDYDLKR